MDILLIRHGETVSGENYFSVEKNRPDPPLSPRGRAQAELLGKRLEDAGIRFIYTSDLIRAMETAQIANRSIGAEVAVRAELREIDMGRLHACSWEDIRTEDPALAGAWLRHETDMPYPGGESGGDAAARAMAVIGEIIAAGHESAAVVTHGGIIRALICAVLGIGQEKRFLLGPPENTSVSVLRHDRQTGRFDLFAMNDFSHLGHSIP